MDPPNPDDSRTEESMVRSGQEARTDKEMEKKGKRLSRKKSKNRSRKKRSHSKGVADVEVEPAETDDTKETAGKLSRQNSIPSREQKTRSLSGSRKRLSGWFKRKSRSESRGRSKSETELNKVDRNEKAKRHESAEDIKRGSKSQNDSNRDSTYEMYDITKQPRDRLRRMTVRDAVKERRLRKVASGHTLSRLDRYIDTEEGPRERTRTSSLPDITAVDPQGDNTNKYTPDESKDAIDSASTLVRGSVTLPRENKNRLGKKQKPPKAGRVSIEADSDDNIISSEVSQNAFPQVSSRIKENDTTKKSPSRQPSPQTQIQAVVHEEAKSEPEIEISSKNQDLSENKSSQEKVTKDVTAPVEQSSQSTTKPVTASPKENEAVQDKPTPEQVTPTKDKPSEKPSDKACENSSETKDKSKLGSTEMQEGKDNEKSVASTKQKKAISEKKVPKVCVLKGPPTKAMKRWQTAILDVQKKRRQESLSRFLELSRSPNPYSLMGRSISRDLSPFGLTTSRSPSPRAKRESLSQDVKAKSALLPEVNKKDNTAPVPVPVPVSKSNQAKPESEFKEKSSLGVPHVLDRSLSDGEGRTVLEKQDKTSKCKRSPSALSDRTKPSDSPKTGERNGVPVMGTSVQQKYKRTFSPKRQETPVIPDKEETKEVGSDLEKERSKQTKPDEKDTQNESRDKENENEAKNEAKNEAEVSKVNKDTEKAIDNSEMSKALDNRGRESQRRRLKSSRSFRRKKEVEEEVIKADDAQKQEAVVAKEDELSPIRPMYDKSTQTSEIDLTELAKSIGKSKKSKKTKKDKDKDKDKSKEKEKDKEKEKERDKKKFKEIVSLIQEPNKEEEKKLGKVDEQVDNKTVDNEKPKDSKLAEKKDPIKLEQTSDAKTKPESEKKTGDNGSKAKPKKLSFTTMVFLKQRIASRRKKKEEGDKDKKNKNEQDSNKDMFLIENEINLSKLADIKETDILDDEIIEPGLDLPRKQIRFEPIASDEPIQGEEPLPPLNRNRAKRLSGRRENTMRDKRRKCLQCCKKFTAFLFSHIGLCSLVVAYTIMGGFIFKAIEGPFEDKVKTIIRDTRVKLVDKMLQHATELSLSEIGHDNFTSIVDEHLKEFQRTVFQETKEHGWDGKDKTDSDIPEMQWSFASSLLYAITVMTTIGYGHVAPKTDQGRIVTIGYAVLGIPLTLLCLTNIGDVMATGFRLLYGKVCCGLCCKLFRPRRRRIPDLEKGLAHHQVMASEEEEADKPKEVIHVPTSLCILLIAGYIFAGALLFALWEKWDYLTGSYFCFITLSTIGFGDIVPGTDLNAWSQEEKLVLCAMYLVFGLSLIAMCFNLVQEDVKAKCRWLGMKMGIIEKPESSV